MNAGPISAASRLAVRLSILAILALPAANARAQFLYRVDENGKLFWSEHLGAPEGTPAWTISNRVANPFWDGALFPGGLGVLYWISPDGSLQWKRHLAFRDGNSGADNTPSWTGTRTMGTGWSSYTAVLSGGAGSFYAIEPDGTLRWSRNHGWLTGDSLWTPSRVVGSGWNQFATVFAGEGGSLYGIREDGTLVWHRHLGEENGDSTWLGPIEIGEGWDDAATVFASGDGVLYAVRGDSLLWYRHRGYRDGVQPLDGPELVATGWTAPSFAVGVPLEGYCWPQSVQPGQTISFYVTSPSPWSATFVRFEGMQWDQNVPVPLTSPLFFPAALDSVPYRAWWYGAGWTQRFEIEIPMNWSSGIDAVILTDGLERTFSIPFVVQPLPGQRKVFAVIASTNTWSAYNNWGGRSKYTNPPGYNLSFQRPNPGAQPLDAGGENHLARAELWVLDWLRAAGYPFDVYSDRELHEGIPGLADDYVAVILNTHPEYVSHAMFDHLEAFLAAGRSLVYLGGNGLFEEIQFHPDGVTQVMFPEGTASRAMNYFRNLYPPRPERELLGVAYRSTNFRTYAPFRVMAAAHPFFAGTGLANGDLIGATGWNGAASGWELDTSIPGEAADSVIVTGSSSADDRGVPPGNLVLLARGTNVGGGGEQGADMVTYETGHGGFVFSAGSLSFGGSLVVDSTLQHVVRNVLDALWTSTTGIAENRPRADFGSNRPNPFRSTTRWEYALAFPGSVRLEVFDLAGRRVAKLIDRVEHAGTHEAAWNGEADSGSPAPAGVYLYRLEIREQGGQRDRRIITRRMVLLR